MFYSISIIEAMPFGNYYVGKGGFAYKKSGGGGNHRNPKIGLITGIPAGVNNKYVAGSGVGGQSIATRRAKLNHATSCAGPYPCNLEFTRLGLYAQGGSSNYALNWYLLNYVPPIPASITPTPTPTPTPSVTEGSLAFDGTSTNLENSTLTITPALTSIGNQDFTIEGWFYLNAQQTSSGFIGAATILNGFSIRIESNIIRLDFLQNTNIQFIFSSNFVLNQWYYLSVVRQSISGTQYYMVFINGNRLSNLPQPIQISGVNVNISVSTIDLIGGWNVTLSNPNTSFVFNGNLSSIRIVSGTALYPINGTPVANFTPPSFPLTAIPNTIFLLQTTTQNPFQVLPSGSVINNGGVVASALAP